MKTLFTMKECTQQLGKSQRTIQRYLKDGVLEKVEKRTSKGKVRYITVSSVARYIRNHSKEVIDNE